MLFFFILKKANFPFWLIFYIDFKRCLNVYFLNLTKFPGFETDVFQIDLRYFILQNLFFPNFLIFQKLFGL